MSQELMLLIKIIGFIIFIEGFTELCVNTESIVYKHITSKWPAWIPIYCGWCFSLWIAAGFSAIWFFTPLIYPLSIISFWRFSNIFHTFQSWLLRLKMFTGGKSSR